MHWSTLPGYLLYIVQWLINSPISSENVQVPNEQNKQNIYLKTNKQTTLYRDVQLRIQFQDEHVLYTGLKQAYSSWWNQFCKFILEKRNIPFL